MAPSSKETFKTWYRLDATPLGAGGYAVVTRAERRDGGGFVALKRLLWEDRESIDRLRREIEIQRHLAHRNMMPILHHDENEGGPTWYAMPLAVEALYRERGRLPIPD